MRWRWHEASKPGTPWDNMARDAALLDELAADRNAPPIVRVYHWDRPSVSIGRLQDEEAVRKTYPEMTPVRRPTGGRAVVHGNDVTLTVAAHDHDLPTGNDRGVLASYRQIVSGIVEAFQSVGVQASLGDEGRAANRADSVDCFAVAARCDIVETRTGHKLAGCAQRRQNGVILQQMSVPLSGVPDEAAFLDAVRTGMAWHLGVSAWVSVDTPCPV
jgi:lipoate-protein ligase A